MLAAVSSWFSGSSRQPGDPPEPRFKVKAKNQQEEDAYDWAAHRDPNAKFSGPVGSVAHLVKGALGGGILSAHVGYKMAGLGPGLALSILAAVYVGYCLHILVISAHTLYRRTQIPVMSYPDVGEAACACFPKKSVARLAKLFRYKIDIIICIDLFGSCACYQLMIAKTIKQLVENSSIDTNDGPPGYPGIRVYLAGMIIPLILIHMITELKWLAPFSLVANFFIFCCIGVTIYYFSQRNASFENIIWVKDLYGITEYSGMAVFSMSCVGIILPVTNNLQYPTQSAYVLLCGMCIIALFVVSMAMFGYVAFLEGCQSPITLNFPLDLLPKILKGLIAGMIYVTHALNFFIPFQLCWHYMKKKIRPDRLLKWELIYRALFVTAIAIIAIAFPAINPLMGFLGAFCLSNMAFIWPNLIEMMVLYERPGYGPHRWRLWKAIILVTIGLLIMVFGSVVNGISMVKALSA